MTADQRASLTSALKVPSKPIWLLEFPQLPSDPDLGSCCPRELVAVCQADSPLHILYLFSVLHLSYLFTYLSHALAVKDINCLYPRPTSQQIV